MANCKHGNSNSYFRCFVFFLFIFYSIFCFVVSVRFCLARSVAYFSFTRSCRASSCNHWRFTVCMPSSSAWVSPSFYYVAHSILMEQINSMRDVVDYQEIFYENISVELNEFKSKTLHTHEKHNNGIGASFCWSWPTI